MKYGLPYKGSKNKLAERIVSLLPKRTHLIDLFCGGCAVSHAALVKGKYQHIHINDINWMCPTLFIDALNGKYNDETRWISREDFERLKKTDPYVAFVWSFGNNLKGYLYSKEIEPFKRALHHAIFFADYEPAKEFDLDLSFLDALKKDAYQKRYFAVKHYVESIKNTPPRTGWNQQSDTLQRLQSAEASNVLKQASHGVTTHRMLQQSVGLQKKKSTNDQRRWSIANAEDGFWRLQYRERHHRLPRYSGGGAKLPITKSVLDYAELEIPADSVIYCDIPYEGTEDYNLDTGGKNSFDYERFYQWCERQTEPVFISSYDMPADRFDCIEEYTHRSTLSASANNLVTERIFVPKHQTERGTPRPKQLSLFDDL